MHLVLVINSDPLQRARLINLLASPERRILEAADGKEGMSLFHEAHPGLVFTDIFMPEKDGLETIIEIRRHDIETKIVAMAPDPHYLGIARLLGADEILEMPFHDDAVRRLAAHLLAMDRRTTPRKSVLWSAQLQTASGLVDCLVLNVSLGGAKLQLKAPLKETNVTLLLSRFGSHPAIVRWRSGDHLGIQFTEPPERVVERIGQALMRDGKPRDET